MAKQVLSNSNSNSDSDSVGEMVGLGPKSTQWLHQAGITRASQVRSLGAVACYLRVMQLGTARPNLNLLWALQGAIDDIHWTLVPPQHRLRLKTELDQRLTQQQPANES